jgi:hypothetical protein
MLNREANTVWDVRIARRRPVPPWHGTAWGSPGDVGATRLVSWDFAGARTLIGLCAAQLGEPEQAVALLERNRM